MPSRPVRPRDQTILLKLSPEEYQLIAYAASKSRSRGVNAWMRDRLLRVARTAIGGRRARDILAGEATLEIMRESIAPGRRPAARANVVPFRKR